jgi:hypothetical protein
MKEQLDPRLLKGVREFNLGRYFECHETLEEIWMEDNSESRRFIQGLIQIASGYLKWEGQVPRGAIKLWRAGLEKIAPYAPRHMRIDLGEFIFHVRADLTAVEAAMEAGVALPSIDPPKLRFVSERAAP